VRHAVDWEASGSNGGRRFAAFVRDISVTGMRIESDVSFKAGQILRLMVQSAHDGFAAPVYFECQIIKVRGAGTRLPHAYGAKLKRIRESDRVTACEWFIRATAHSSGARQLQAQRSGLSEIERLPPALEAERETSSSDMRLAS